MAIDATARLADGARIGDGVEIGPYCVVGPHVELKDGVRLIGQVNVTGVTTVGEGTAVYPFASLGTAPQSVHYRGEPTQLVIGARCEVREGVTMNIGTKPGGGITRVGERCVFMVGSHVAHDCNVGDDVTFANNAVLGWSRRRRRRHLHRRQRGHRGRVCRRSFGAKHRRVRARRR